MIKKIILIGIILFSTACAQTGINTAKKAKIEQLLEVTGSLKLGAAFGKALINQIYASYQKMGTSVSDSVLKIMEKEIGILIDNEMKIKSGLVDQLCELYDKYYSEKNLDDLLKFYNTETGKKVIATLPQLTQESMAIGQQWGMQKGQAIAQKLMENMKKKGISLPPI